MRNDEGRDFIVILLFLLISALMLSPFIHSKFTTSKQWTGERMVAEMTIEVTQWGMSDPPRGWVVANEDQLKECIREIYPDTYARFSAGYGTFFRMTPQGEIKKEVCPDEQPGKNNFQIFVKKERKLLTTR